jgi:hypothetical protein
MSQALATAIVSPRGRLRYPVARLHGTAKPALIDKAQSHGCERLTNWYAKELAGVLERGVDVEKTSRGGLQPRPVADSFFMPPWLALRTGEGWIPVPLPPPMHPAPTFSALI